MDEGILRLETIEKGILDPGTLPAAANEVPPFSSRGPNEARTRCQPERGAVPNEVLPNEVPPFSSRAPTPQHLASEVLPSEVPPFSSPPIRSATCG